VGDKGEYRLSPTPASSYSRLRGPLPTRHLALHELGYPGPVGIFLVLCMCNNATFQPFPASRVRSAHVNPHTQMGRTTAMPSPVNLWGDHAEATEMTSIIPPSSPSSSSSHQHRLAGLEYYVLICCLADSLMQPMKPQPASDCCAHDCFSSQPWLPPTRRLHIHTPSVPT
jgi:hypothetical protein